MKIAVLSDTHDNHPVVDIVIDYLNENNITVCIHCGDIVQPALLAKFGENFNGTLHIVPGNNDGERVMLFKFAQDYSSKVVYYPSGYGTLEIVNKKIFINHYSEIGIIAAQSKLFDFCFAGHDHLYRAQKFGQTLFINPGTFNLNDKYQKPLPHTFALVDLDNASAEFLQITREQEVNFL